MEDLGVMTAPPSRAAAPTINISTSPDVSVQRPESLAGKTFVSLTTSMSPADMYCAMSAMCLWLRTHVARSRTIILSVPRSAAGCCAIRLCGSS